MSDELNLLRDGIPTGIALILLVVAVGAIGAVVATILGWGNEKTLRYTSAILCLLGLGVAGYVAVKVSSGGIPQCVGVGGGGGCATVEKSKYSELLGIHISFFGLLGYVLILGLSLWRDDRARVGAFIFALFGFGFSMYLTYLELWTIKAICQWCIGSALLMTLLFITSTTRMLMYFGLDEDGLVPDGAEVANPSD